MTEQKETGEKVCWISLCKKNPHAIVAITGIVLFLVGIGIGYLLPHGGYSHRMPQMEKMEYGERGDFRQNERFQKRETREQNQESPTSQNGTSVGSKVPQENKQPQGNNAQQQGTPLPTTQTGRVQ